MKSIFIALRSVVGGPKDCHLIIITIPTCRIVTHYTDSMLYAQLVVLCRMPILSQVNQQSATRKQ